jgi:hypothetical protein
MGKAEQEIIEKNEQGLKDFFTKFNTDQSAEAQRLAEQARQQQRGGSQQGGGQRGG